MDKRSTMSNVAARARTVLISGASIAGPTLAYWLDRFGFDVTLVERAPAVRSGGYPIDIRGVATEVVERMGVWPQIQAAHIASRTLTFVGALGETIGVVPIYDFQGSETADVELPRGDLTRLLYGLTKDGRVRYRFEDSIEAIEDDGVCADVRFKCGERQRYDVVIGADGLHSNTRRLVFGPEAPFNHYLGHTFNLFSMPNDLGLSNGGTIYAEPGRAAGLYAVGATPKELFAFLIFATETPPFGAHPNKAEQIERTAAMFAGCGWDVPRLVEALRRADDLFFDTVSQIRMPCWSKGRVGLVGDAAFAPSFRSGQGTSLALVGAYVLAGELAAHDDPAEAFAAYERTVRIFVDANQGLALKEKGDLLLPRTQEQLDARNRMLASIHAAPAGAGNANNDARSVHNGLMLPDYGSAMVR
jgi:2-polyprenyl-6-methoxyphenol hydroxylase-like FAD-dependent oxidoreductase